MLYRRVTGVLACLLTLQLLLVGSELACFEQRDTRAQVALVTSADQTGGEHQHGTPGQREHGAPHGAPDLANCCQAMTTCSAGVALAVSELAVSLPHSGRNALTAITAVVTSRTETPDPPPPKA